MNLVLTFLLMAHTVSPNQAHLNAILARAAALGDTQKIAACLRDGANVNARTLLDQTPLELAVEYRHYEASRLLLDNRANVNLGSGFGTPLTWAADGDVAISRLLLERGAWVDYGGQSATPLTVAVLSLKGAQDGSENPLGLTVQITPDTPHNRRLAHLYKAKEEERSVRQFVGSSQVAFEQHRIHASQIVRLLLARGADVNAKDELGMTALWYASLSGALDVVKALIAGGAEVNAQDRSGTTALFNAVRGQNLELVHFLLESGADPNLSPKSDETILEAAKRYGDPAILASLQKAGAKK